MAGDIDKIKGIRDEIPSTKKKEDIRDPEVFREKYLKVGQAEEEQKQDPKKKKTKQAGEEKKDQEEIAAPDAPQVDVAFGDVLSDADLEASDFEVEGSGGPKRTLGSSRQEGAQSGKSGYAPTVSEEDYWGTSSNDIQYEESPEVAATPPSVEDPSTPPPTSSYADEAPPPPPTEESAPPEEAPAQAAPPAPEEPVVAATPPPLQQPAEPEQPAPPSLPGEEQQPAIPDQPPVNEQGQGQQQQGEQGQKDASDKKSDAVDEFLLGTQKPKKMSLKQKRFIAKQKKLQKAREEQKAKQAPDQTQKEHSQVKEPQQQSTPSEQGKHQEEPPKETGATATSYQTSDEGKKISGQKGMSQETERGVSPISSHESKEHQGDQDSDTDGERDQQDQQQGSLAAAALAGSGVTPITGFDTQVPGVETVQGARPTLLPQDMEEIINRCAGVITVMKEGGLTTTSVEVNMPGSVFDGSTIVLKESDTAKGTYNLQFQGSPEAINLFNASAADLAASLQGRRFEVNILTSELSKKHRASYRVQGAKDKGQS